MGKDIDIDMDVFTSVHVNTHTHDAHMGGGPHEDPSSFHATVLTFQPDTNMAYHSMLLYQISTMQSTAMCPLLDCLVCILCAVFLNTSCPRISRSI